MYRSLVIVSFIAFAAPAARAASVQDCTAAACSDSVSKYSFGAGYTILSRTSYTSGTLGVDGRLTAKGELFGTWLDLIQVRGFGSTTPGGSRSYAVNTYVWLPLLGKIQLTTASADLASSAIVDMYGDVSRTFATVEARFYGVLSVKAKARGAAGYDAYGRVDGSRVSMFFKPYANASVTLTASVDVYVAEFGAYGRLYLIDASLPMTTIIATNSSTQCAGYNSYLKVDLTLEELSGELGVFLRLLTGEYDHDFWSWDGAYQTFPVMPGASKTVCL